MPFQPVRFPPCPDDPDYLEVGPQDVWLLRATALHVHRVDGRFAVYKAAGSTLRDMGLGEDDLPRRLYMRRQDRELAVQDIQLAMLDGQFRDMVRQGDQAMVKVALVSLFEEALAEPRIAVLANFKPLLAEITEVYADDPKLLRGFTLLAGQGYSLAEHGVNVMALVVGVALRLGLPRGQVVDLALAGLLHDLGKTRLPAGLRIPDHPLSDQEFARYRGHPLEGLGLLRSAELSPLILAAATQHHERLDGRGYPKGITKISLAGQVVGLADCYENLTTQAPGSRHRWEPLKTLALLKEEVEEGKFDPKLFRAFARSLVD